MSIINESGFIYETHMHTSHGSACSASSAKEMVEYYKNIGYSGLVVTDHFFNGNSGIDRKQPWKEKVSQFTEGWYRAKEAGDRLDFDVFFGLEFNYRGTEFLFYNVTEKWLLENEKIMSMGLVEVLKYARDENIFVIQAHPFREDFYIDYIRLVPNHVDAFEVYNSGNIPRGKMQNMFAYEFAKAHGLPMTSGTDLHSNDGKGFKERGGIITRKRCNNINDLILSIKNKDVKLICGESEYISP